MTITVQALIDLLSALPDEQKSFLVGYSYDSDCAWGEIQGIKDVTAETDGHGNAVQYVRLQGE